MKKPPWYNETFLGINICMKSFTNKFSHCSFTWLNCNSLRTITQQCAFTVSVILPNTGFLLVYSCLRYLKICQHFTTFSFCAPSPHAPMQSVKNSVIVFKLRYPVVCTVLARQKVKHVHWMYDKDKKLKTKY